MRINTNVNAMVAVNQMAKNTALQSNSMEKLSTGLRINKAADDAAGLAISEKMRSQIRGMEQADRNVQDGISMIQTAEGALEEATNIAQRMRELTIQGANDTNTAEDREKINAELSQLGEELGKISEEAKFNEKQLLSGERLTTNGKFGEYVKVTADGKYDKMILEVTELKLTDSLGNDQSSLVLKNKANNDYYSLKTGRKLKQLTSGIGSTTGMNYYEDTKAGGNGLNSSIFKNNAKDPEIIKIQAGANKETRDIKSLNLAALSETLTDLRVSTSTGATLTTGKTNHNVAQNSMDKIDAALKQMNTARSQFGAQQNRLEYTSANLNTSSENLTAAESRIRDVDVAKEMINLSKLNIITQASQSMAAQAKQQPQGVMQLLN